MKLLKYSLNLLIRPTGFLFLSMLFEPTSFAKTYILNGHESIGRYEKYIVKNDETLLEIAHHFDVGMGEIIEANPGLNHRSLEPGTVVQIPSQFQLPRSVPHEGIVLNAAQLRIYYFHPDGIHVSTYPVGLGKKGWSTPLGSTTIMSKVKNPTWHPTPAIMQEAARQGRVLRVVGPGPRNPLGAYAMHLGFKNIMIHGTTSPESVGLRSSHGCIRMFGKDIQELFSYVPIGTPVKIINEAIK
jgi:L,D-transpeptidase ErfK/SrfK